METDVPDEETSTEAPASPNNPNTEEESKTPEELATEERIKQGSCLIMEAVPTELLPNQLVEVEAMVV